MKKLRVRLVKRQELEKYQGFMERHHYLGAVPTHVGKALQYVAEDAESEEWYALLDWGYGALKNASREAWIGWDRVNKDARLKYVVTNGFSINHCRN